MNRNARSLETKKSIRLNLGCGLNAVPGWVNIDKSFSHWLSSHPIVKRCLKFLRILSENQFRTSWPPNIHRADVTKGLDWPAGSVDAIYSSHMLEHLTPQESSKLLKECLRVLAPRGILRLALPDLEEMADTYVAGKRRGSVTAGDDFIEALYLVPQFEGSRSHRWLMRFVHRPHQWMYDFDSISLVLRNTGFNRVDRRAYREGLCPDLELIENRPESLFVEARRSVDSRD